MSDAQRREAQRREAQRREAQRREAGTTEVRLEGGVANRGLVVRVGDTVRRPPRATGPATHALLRHLEQVGFDGAPRYLGTDARGREVLTYVHGDAVNPPYPEWALSEEALRSVARLLRRYHQAVADFDPLPYAWPASPPHPYAGSLVTHNDPNPNNVVFRDGQAVAFIDFDLASPGTAVWDVASAARLWAPVMADSEILDSRRGQGLARFRLFVETYGSAGLEPERLVDALLLNHGWLYSIVQFGAEHGNRGFQDYWHEVASRVARTGRWYAANRQALVEALQP